MFADGKPKPLAAAFPNPFYVDALSGRRARFWGQVRPGGATRVALEVMATSGWKTVVALDTDARGYWSLVRSLPATGTYRFTYGSPPELGGMPRTLASATQRVIPRS
jgi:hypothetical protein